MSSSNRGKRKVYEIPSLPSRYQDKGTEITPQQQSHQSHLPSAKADCSLGHTAFDHVSEPQSTDRHINEDNYEGDKNPTKFQDGIETNLSDGQNVDKNKCIKSNSSNAKSRTKMSSQIIETREKLRAHPNAASATQNFPRAGTSFEQFNCDVLEVDACLSMPEQTVCHPKQTQDEIHTDLSNVPVRRERYPIAKSLKLNKIQEHLDCEVLKESLKGTISKNVAENLLHFIDGKPSQHSLKKSNFSYQPYSPNNLKRGSISGSSYNFAEGNNINPVKKNCGQVKNQPSDNISFSDKCLLSISLESFQTSTQTIIEGTCGNPIKTRNSASNTAQIPLIGYHMQKINIEERKKLIGKDGSVTILCYVCRETFMSYEAFEEHCENSHPNTECTSIEFEGSRESPSFIPEELLRKPEITPVGMLATCYVPPASPIEQEPPSPYSNKHKTSTYPIRQEQSSPYPIKQEQSAPNPTKQAHSTPNPIKKGLSAPNPIKKGLSAPNPIKKGLSASNPIKKDHTAPNPIKQDHTAPNPIKQEHSNYTGDNRKKCLKKSAKYISKDQSDSRSAKSLKKGVYKSSNLDNSDDES